MPSPRIIVLTSSRQTQRQIQRTLFSAGHEALFVNSPEALVEATAQGPAELLVVDCDMSGTSDVEVLKRLRAQIGDSTPLFLLSQTPNRSVLLEMLRSHDVENLVAKHGAIRASFPILDERELLVTCEKLLRRDIFGIEKYIGTWGAVLHRRVIKGLAEKAEVLEELERYLVGLDCPQRFVPAIATVADEFIVNAVIHAPRDREGRPKYEHLGARSGIVLEPHEQVELCYGCDGQRLMLSVADSFGALDRGTLLRYLTRACEGPLEPETKASGAGLGLSLSLDIVHQLIFNVQNAVRTEAIAGWYLRVNSVSEFQKVGKSLNIFWLPT